MVDSAERELARQLAINAVVLRDERPASRAGACAAPAAPAATAGALPAAAAAVAASGAAASGADGLLPQSALLAPAEAALARTEAAVAAARGERDGPGGRPSRARVEAARAQLHETRQALATMKSEVQASLGTLKAQMEADVTAAFRAQGWALPQM